MRSTLGSDQHAVVDGIVRLLRGRRVLMLTGAGISTDSGIPDYRGPDAPPRRPMTISQFRSGPAARKRYWARSHIGWQAMRRALPNDGHRAVAELQRRGAVGDLITQNVDGLHREAGSQHLVELHGRIDQVRCLDCGTVSSRRRLEERLTALNPDFGPDRPVEVAPDGDAVIEDVDDFVVAECEVCGGVLKPNVVFFGENVDPAVVEHCFGLVQRSDALLVAGSSLAVLSGFRFARRAHQLQLPLVIVNRGPTRADDLATVRLEAGCTESLVELVNLL